MQDANMPTNFEIHQSHAEKEKIHVRPGIPSRHIVLYSY